MEFGGAIREFDVQKKIENVIPDAYIEYDYNGYRHFIFLEVERSNNRFNQEKYEELLAKNIMTIFPKVAIISDRKIKLYTSKINYYILNSKMKNLYSIFNNI